MGKNIYIGVDNVARKVKQPNIGVDGVARKVKSGFIGVDNVARQFYEGIVYNTWKKYNLIGPTYSLSSNPVTKFYPYDRAEGCSISIDNNISEPNIFVCNKFYYSAGNNYFTISSLNMETATISTSLPNYSRYPGNTYNNDKVVQVTNPVYVSSRAWFVIPGWNTAPYCLQYQSGSSTVYRFRRLVPDPNYITIHCYTYKTNSDGDVTARLYYYTTSNTNYITTVTAPQGTYPDNGLHTDGCIYIKQ